VVIDTNVEGAYTKLTYLAVVNLVPELGMHRILLLPDIRLIQKLDTGYPANPKVGYRITGKGRIPDIRTDAWLDIYIFGQISNKLIKKALTIIDFCKL
jgi:hypothetical protein